MLYFFCALAFTFPVIASVAAFTLLRFREAVRNIYEPKTANALRGVESDKIPLNLPPPALSALFVYLLHLINAPPLLPSHLPLSSLRSLFIVGSLRFRCKIFTAMYTCMFGLDPKAAIRGNTCTKTCRHGGRGMRGREQELPELPAALDRRHTIQFLRVGMRTHATPYDGGSVLPESVTDKETSKKADFTNQRHRCYSSDSLSKIQLTVETLRCKRTLGRHTRATRSPSRNDLVCVFNVSHALDTGEN